MTIRSLELTNREKEILQQLFDNNGNKKRVLENLLLTENTLKCHLKNINNKLDGYNLTEALIIAIKKGLIKI